MKYQAAVIAMKGWSLYEWFSFLVVVNIEIEGEIQLLNLDTQVQVYVVQMTHVQALVCELKYPIIDGGNLR